MNHIAIVCPACHSEPGNLCVSVATGRTVNTHAARMRGSTSVSPRVGPSTSITGDERAALVQRIAKLEGHRRRWRDYAMQIGGMVLRGETEAALEYARDGSAPTDDEAAAELDALRAVALAVEALREFDPQTTLPDRYDAALGAATDAVDAWRQLSTNPKNTDSKKEGTP